MTGGGHDPGRVFAALADPRRRELLELLARTSGASAGTLADCLPVSRQAVAQHLTVLEESCLVSRRRAGRQVLFSVRPEGLRATADWLAARAAAWLIEQDRADQVMDPLLRSMSVVWNWPRRGTLAGVVQINPAADSLVGEWLSLPDVAGQLDLPISRVKQLLRDRKLLAVTRPNGERAVPAAFLAGGQIVKGLSGTLTLLFDCGFDETEALRWLFTADETLPGTPIEALCARRGTEVNRRAQALAF